MSILALNAGSSTLKYGLFDDAAAAELASGTVELDTAAPDAPSRIAETLGTLPRVEPREVRAVGHRVVHGGERFRASALVDAEVIEALEEVSRLAPLHNPPALATLAAARRRFPDVPHAAVFDTAFFGDLPEPAIVYPLPWEWFSEWRIRRFGFHGISHGYCAGRAAEMLGGAAAGAAVVICHLGNGCSATAVRGRRPVATTMGYTPIEGLMMGTRPGSVDPGILLDVARRHGLSREDLEDVFQHRSGLLGVSGVSSDYREVERAAEAGNARAALALTMHAERVRGAIGALAALLSGLDAIVFTAGIGENSARLRESVCAGLEFLGVRLDAARNVQCRPDADVAADDSRVRVLVLHTREELAIAREALRVSRGS